MLTAAKKALFLRALAGLAWADHRVDEAERELVKDVAGRLGVGGEDLAGLDRLLDEPMDAEDSEALLQDFMRGTLTRGERAQLLELLSELALADGEVSEGEARLIRQIRRSVELGAPLGRVREALRRRGGR